MDSIGPESEQTPRALEALEKLQESALDAIESGANAVEVIAELDESLEEFHSSVEDAEGETFADIDREAVDSAIDQLGEKSTDVTQLGLDVASDTASSLASDDERLSVAFDGSSVSSVSDDSSDDEWSTATSPTPLPERRADLAATLTRQLANPAARGPRTEEEEAQAVGEAKGAKQQAAVAASRARRKDPEEQAQRTARAQQRAQEEAERKIEQAAEEARKELRKKRLASKFGALRETGGFTPEPSAISHPSASSIVAQSPVPPVPTLQAGTPVQAVSRAPPRAQEDDGNIIEDPSLDINEEAEQSLAEVPFSDEESVSYYQEATVDALDQIDALLAEAKVAVAQSVNLDAVSPVELSTLMEKEVSQKLDMEIIKDRLTDPAQARAFSAATRNTPRLLKLIAQGVYAPTAFIGPTGKESAAKIEQQLAYTEASKQRTGTRRAADPIVTRERPTRNNPEIRRWRRPRFTTTTVR
eukprot:COSAG02_NODE_4016_length_5901_cov_42.404688_3_plen_474_part_00